MNKLLKHHLDFDTSYHYFKDNLEKTNTLSTELVKIINFREGHFFTLLPECANIQAMNDFNAGGILPLNPIKEYFINGNRRAYSIKKSIHNELSEWISKELLNHNFTCVFDDVNCSPPRFDRFSFIRRSWSCI